MTARGARRALPIAILAAASLAAAACGGARPPAPRGGSARASAPDPFGLALAAPVTGRAARAGASAPRLLARGALAPGDTIGAELSPAPGQCVLVLGAGVATVTDLDVVVYSEDGALLGADERRDGGPVALVCPPLPARAYAFARLAAGHGPAALVAQDVPAVAARAAAVAAGAAPEIREGDAVADEWPGLAAARAERRRRLGEEGRELLRVVLPVDPRAVTRAPVLIPPHACVDVLAIPAEEIAAVELTLEDEEGRVVGRAEDGAELPSAIACAEDGARLSAALRPRAGRGLAALVVTLFEPGGPALRARAAHVGGQAAAPTLAAARARLAATLRAPRGAAPRTLLETDARPGGLELAEVSLPGGCHRLDALGSAGARDLHLRVWSPAEQLLAEAEGQVHAGTELCAPAGRYGVELGTGRGPGRVAVDSRPVPPRRSGSR